MTSGQESTPEGPIIIVGHLLAVSGTRGTQKLDIGLDWPGAGCFDTGQAPQQARLVPLARGCKRVRVTIEEIKE